MENVVTRVLSLSQADDDLGVKSEPASKKRQKEIFKMQKLLKDQAEKEHKEQRDKEASNLDEITPRNCNLERNYQEKHKNSRPYQQV